MHTFKDANGKVWTVTVDVDAIKTVKALVGVNLCELHEGSPPLVERLEGDLILLCDVLFAVLKEQADAAGIDEKKFARLLGGQAISDAINAFWEELVDFFRYARPVLAEMASAYMTAMRARATAISEMTKAKSPSLPSEPSVSGIGSGTSPASSESIPAS